MIIQVNIIFREYRMGPGKLSALNEFLFCRDPIDLLFNWRNRNFFSVE